MSWLFSQALVEEYSEESCSDGEQCAPLSVMPTQQQFWHRGKMIDFSSLSQFGLMCAALTEARGEELLMSCLADFHARTFPAQEKAQESKEAAQDCGNTWRELSARYDLDLHSWRTANCLFPEGLPWSSVTLPKSGIAYAGCLYQQKNWERITTDLDYGGLPTPSGVNGGRNHTMGRLDEWGGQLKYVAWDRNWESALREFRGVDDGMAYGVERTDTIRNGQVPAVAATAFRILSGE